ncbi:hypothetical protein ABBQ38_008827 [Trebouxia sp. C0009 RCD-2024]
MEWLWDVSCRLLQAAACALLSFFLVPSAAYLWLHFIAATALDGIMDAGNAVRAQCRCRYARLDLTGKQRRALERQLQRLTSEKEALETQLSQNQHLAYTCMPCQTTRIHQQLLV